MIYLYSLIVHQMTCFRGKVYSGLSLTVRKIREEKYVHTDMVSWMHIGIHTHACIVYDCTYVDH